MCPCAHHHGQHRSVLLKGACRAGIIRGRIQRRARRLTGAGATSVSGGSTLQYTDGTATMMVGTLIAGTATYAWQAAGTRTLGKVAFAPPALELILVLLLPSFRDLQSGVQLDHALANVVDGVAPHHDDVAGFEPWQD